MNQFSTKLFSSTRTADKLERDLQKAISTSNQQKVTSTFSRLFVLLLREERVQPLSNLVLSYSTTVENAVSLESEISSVHLKQAVSILEENRLDTAALMLCDRFGYDTEAITILAKRGQANEVSMRLSKGNVVDKHMLGTAVLVWEKSNGDIRSNSTMVGILANIAKASPESIPDLPRVKEIVGMFKEAATLYSQEGDLSNAARCFEQAEMFVEACKTYEKLGDGERASQAAEAAGDLAESARLARNPERKLRLLIRLGKFVEAREIATRLESPYEYFELIKDHAKKGVEIRLLGHDFVGALELADIAECDEAKREEILLLGRQHFDKRITSAPSQGALQSIYRERVEFEEKAGHFEDAGKLAEEVLGDLELASFLYEKASLFDRAIGAASGHSERTGRANTASIRLAELHEKGGSLTSAARLYESAGQYDKAYALYESVQQYNKALECYLKTANPSRNDLIRLYSEAGEFEKVVEIYMDSGTFPDLEMALFLAESHRLPSHISFIKNRLSEFVRWNETELEQCFTSARDEVLGTYSPVIGIDFGTTNSVAAIFNKESGKVEIVTTSRGSEFEPSFFGVDENKRPIFGEAARMRSLTAPDCVVARVKRSLGGKKPFYVAGKQYGCEEVVAHFLRQLGSNTEAYVQSKVKEKLHALLDARNLRIPAEALRAFLDKQRDLTRSWEIVLSVPAYFNDNQKRATRDSAEIAGFRVRRLLHEPTAAALAYSHQKPYSGTLVVIDLGGGTLDISIVEIGEGINDVKAIGGDTKLGGSDIDALLLQYALQNIKEQWGITISEQTHPAEIARLRDACENLKVNLSSASQDTIALAYFLNRPEYTLTVTRRQLESLAKPILNRIESTIKKTIADFGSGIDNFLLVGNATKMPAVSELAKRAVPAKQLMGIDPGIVVATGAVLEGAILSGELALTLLLDIVPYSLGILSVDSGTQDEVISRLIEKNSTIPTRGSSIFTTKEDNQPNVHIKIYQGESPQPFSNYFLGEFILEGIQPALAHVPQIEVTFDINVDCILTVSAVDKVTGKKRSYRVEGAVVLSPQEKQNLAVYFRQKQEGYAFENDLRTLRAEIEVLKSTCNKSIRAAEQSLVRFFGKFHEKAEINPQLYRATPGQVTEIQEMFLQKEQLEYGVVIYRDRYTSILSNLKQTETKQVDFSASDLTARMKDRAATLSGLKRALEDIIKSIEEDITSIVENWITTLESLEPDSEKMTPLEVANFHLIAGRATEARELLEALTASPDGLTNETFHLLLRCYVSLGLREEYRDTYKRFGSLFAPDAPDFNRLNSYLKVVGESIFMIYGISQKHGTFSGTGFCIAPNLIVTNRHVVEHSTQSHIKIIGSAATYSVEQIGLDPANDIAVLTVSESLKPFRLGEFGFVEPGEQVLAIGFPSPNSLIHSENIYISKGNVNSIRKIEASPERVIFVDTKIGRGMSGGPLINDLGEVVGIVTLVRYDMGQSEMGPYVVEDQPVALPIHLVRKYIMTNSI